MKVLATWNLNTLSAIKINVILLFTCVPVSFESFRRDLNEGKAVSSVNIYLPPLCNYDSSIASQVSSNVVN